VGGRKSPLTSAVSPERLATRIPAHNLLNLKPGSNVVVLAMQIPRFLFLPIALLALYGCASTPSPSSASLRVKASDTTASKAADTAVSMLGKPYKYGGNTPTGFDCSGLVHYSYSRVGVDVSRDTRTLKTQTSMTSVSDLRRGDLLFFDQEGQKSSHVGIFIGDGRFVHAPSTGGKVRTEKLDAKYWQKHFVEARRV
jgi:murein DD-endopeptidase